MMKSTSAISTISTILCTQLALCATAACLPATSHASGSGQAGVPAPASVTGADAPVASASPAADGDPFVLAGYNDDARAAVQAAQAAQAQHTDAATPATAPGAALLVRPDATPDIALAQTAPARLDYYVAPNGSDSAAGSKEAPFRTLARAAKAVVKPGTVVWVAPGEYAGGMQTTASGLAKQRIVYISTTKWGARIVPPANSSNDVAWDNRGDHVSIVGFDVDGSTPRGGRRWLHGIYTGGSYGLIQANHVHHIAQSAACNSFGGSAIGADSYFRGVHQEVVANVVHDIGKRNCKFIQGIYMSTSGTILNNLVYRVGDTAIHMWHDATDVVVANNTVAQARYGILVGGGNFYFSSNGNNNTTVANNIVYDNSIGILEHGKTGASNRYLNNLVARNNVAFSLRNHLVASATVSADPLFASDQGVTAGPNFRLSAASPAIGRGNAASAPATDIDGKLRDRGIDIGAYEF